MDVVNHVMQAGMGVGGWLPGQSLLGGLVAGRATRVPAWQGQDLCEDYS